MSLGESNLRPTAMLYRNLASMDVEESIRGNPIDGVVLLVGCDKTTPSLLMGAASCDLPTIVLSGGPMLNGRVRGKVVGSGTAIWHFSEEVKAGRMSLEDFMDAEAGMARSAGSCMTMGTASTMASMVEALGVALPENAALAGRRCPAGRAGAAYWPAHRGDGARGSAAFQHSAPAAFRNAIRVNGAIGGSTNAVLHLLAIAGASACRSRWMTGTHSAATCRPSLICSPRADS